MLTAEQIRRILKLEPHPIEGGQFVETYRSKDVLRADALPPAYSGHTGHDGYGGPRLLATAIYYMLTPDTFSAFHRLPGDEIFHFYLGDPVEMLMLKPDGAAEAVILGQDIAAGMLLQHTVPGGVWQGSRLIAGGKFALLGTTMSPGFDYADYETGQRDELSASYPAHAPLIALLTR